MSGPDAPLEGPRARDGARMAPGGTPFPVDVSRDRRARVVTAMFLAGPVIWSAHFLLVYAVVEAGCTGDGPGLRLFDPPVPTVVTLAATALAALGCLWCARWSHRHWRARRLGPAAGEDREPAHAGGEDPDPGGSLAFAGFLLSLLSFVTVLFVGLPALYLPAC